MKNKIPLKEMTETIYIYIFATNKYDHFHNNDAECQGIRLATFIHKFASLTNFNFLGQFASVTDSLSDYFVYERSFYHIKVVDSFR